MRRLLPLVLLLLAACKSTPVKQYPFKGEVISVDPQSKLATIKNEKVEGWMESMTMEYPVKDAAAFAKLKPGDRIEATVNVRDLQYWLDNVRVKP